MNGKRAKQLRRATGISIQARRAQRVFERQAAQVVVERTDRRASARRLRRLGFAWGALAAIISLIAAGFFL